MSPPVLVLASPDAAEHLLPPRSSTNLARATFQSAFSAQAQKATLQIFLFQ